MKIERKSRNALPSCTAEVIAAALLEKGDIEPAKTSTHKPDIDLADSAYPTFGPEVRRLTTARTRNDASPHYNKLTELRRHGANYGIEWRHEFCLFDAGWNICKGTNALSNSAAKIRRASQRVNEAVEDYDDYIAAIQRRTEVEGEIDWAEAELELKSGELYILNTENDLFMRTFETSETTAEFLGDRIAADTPHDKKWWDAVENFSRISTFLVENKEKHEAVAYRIAELSEEIQALEDKLDALEAELETLPEF